MESTAYLYRFTLNINSNYLLECEYASNIVMFEYNTAELTVEVQVRKFALLSRFSFGFPVPLVSSRPKLFSKLRGWLHPIIKMAQSPRSHQVAKAHFNYVLIVMMKRIHPVRRKTKVGIRAAMNLCV